MKRGMISLIIVLGAMQAMAQHMKPQNLFRTIEENIELTSEQASKMKTLEETVKARCETEEFKQLPREEKRAQMKDVREQVKALLTEEQQVKLKAVQQAKRQERMEMRKEIKAYKTQNIEPVLKAKRQELDQKLTEEEKATITEVRVQMKAIKGDQKRHEISPEQREQIKALVEQLKPIVKAHKSDIKALNAEIEPLRLQWKADIKAIHDKYGAPVREKKVRQPEKRKSDSKKKANKGKHLIRFLLIE